MSQQTDDKGMNLPNPAEIAKTYAEVAQRASRIITQFMEKKAKDGVEAPADELGVAKAFMDLSSRLMANPYKMAQTQMNMMWDYFSLWQNTSMKMLGMPNAAPVAAPKKGDNRFKDEEWEEHFLFDFVKQSYLITARHLHDTVAGTEGLDEATQQKVNFFTRQYIDALSPSNFAMTNPEVFRETVKSHGQNLIKGLNNLLQDVTEDGQLRIRMTDTSAFEMGKNVATTPGKVIFQNELFQLIQYNPTTEKQNKTPFLIVPPWINKYYILDLREKNSMVKWATDQGHTTFIMSWVNPDEKMAKKSFENYLLEGSLEAINQVCAHTGEDSVNLAGYCLGGTLTMSTLAYMAAKKDKRANSATFFTTMLDFSEPGELGIFLDEGAVSGLEKRMAERGFLEGSEMAGTFNMLRANDLIWSFVVNNYLMGKDPFPFDLLYWNSDSTRMPAAMHSFYLRNMYLDNKLREPGGITLGGVKIDISKVKTPCYFISTIEDHIAPWKSTYIGARLPSGNTKFVLGGSGHIAGIVNPPVANKYGFWTNDATDGNLPESPDDFLAGATQNAGSWWTHWNTWVTSLPGGSTKVKARQPADGSLKVIEDAPGAYVKFRLDTQKKVA
jgi:polyhydroxyalkanoate synthase